MKRTLILGCGDLGSTVGVQLAQSHHKVTGIRRQGHKIPTSIEPLALNLFQALPEAEWLSSFSLVYVILTPSERTQNAYEKTYGELVPRIMERLGETNAKQRIVLTSSSHVYAEKEGGAVDEQTPTAAYDYRSSALIQAEKSLFALSPVKEVICVRFSGLYRTESPYLQKQLTADQAIDNPEQYTNRLHREDAVGFLKHMAHLDSPKNIYLASDDCPVTRRELYTTLARAQGLSVRFSSETSSHGKRCLNQRMKDSGYVLQYANYREGFKLPAGI